MAVTEISPRIADEEVLKLTKDDGRMLLTEDTDFGELVYAEGQRNCGVILFRFPANARGPMAAAALDAASRLGDKLQAKFTVIQPGRIRTGRGNR